MYREIKMSRMKFLQINTNRSHVAFDVALATAAKLNIDMILMSEPNKFKIREKWICDGRQDTGILILNKNLRISKQGSGDGFTYVITKDYIIFSCYSSGNREIEQLENLLNEIGKLVRVNKGKAIVAGDFNAKSPHWNMEKTDYRGARLEEWIGQNDLVVHNEGETPTFQTENYGSILDLTITTSEIAQLVNKWDVIEEESLSDHNYIVFEVNQQQARAETTNTTNGWQIRKLEKDKFVQNANKLHWNHKEITAGNFTQSIHRLCDISMPRRRNNPKGKPVYWWNIEISELRNNCLKKRRMYTRKVKKRDLVITTNAWTEYQVSRKEMRNAIKKSKRKQWKKLCEQIDADIWGDGYKIAMKCVIGFAPRPRFTMGKMEEIVRYLFLTENPANKASENNTVIDVTNAVIMNCDNIDITKAVITNCDSNTLSYVANAVIQNCEKNNAGTEMISHFTLEELDEACRKLKTKKAPGPGEVPSEIMKLLAKVNPEYVLKIYNTLVEQTVFPEQWKAAKLVLLAKNNTPNEHPGSFRPLCLLDVEGKLYELLLGDRLDKEIERTGGIDDSQYGFRKGRQTTDAVKKVIRIAERAANYTWKHRKLCVAITLDVKNAFNSAVWEHIIMALHKRGVDIPLIKLIESYLSERRIILEAGSEIKEVEIKGGVPQGSILGPKLWNVLYDDLFKIDLPVGVHMVGFADDVALVVVAETEDLLMTKANTALEETSKWMTSKHLELAPKKSEAVILTTKRKVKAIEFNVMGTVIVPKDAIKYLGVWLDKSLSFKEHVKHIEIKVRKTLTAISRIMPNVSGPRSSKRRIIAGVISSQILYACPAWQKVIENKKLTQKLLSLQRLATIRICSAYRTTSTLALGVIAGVPPIDLMVEERTKKYEGKNADIARRELMQKWQERWEYGEQGRWTKRLIPDIQKWVNRTYGEVDYWLTQALSGHGSFRQYLHKMGKTESAQCSYCECEDSPEHTLFECVRWNERRNSYTQTKGVAFGIESMKNDLISGEKSWKVMYEIVREIMEDKEREERA